MAHKSCSDGNKKPPMGLQNNTSKSHMTSSIQQAACSQHGSEYSSEAKQGNASVSQDWVIDLTLDDSPPALSQEQHPDDFLVARQLQAQFDAEDSEHRWSGSSKKQKLEWYDGNHSQPDFMSPDLDNMFDDTFRKPDSDSEYNTSMDVSIAEQLQAQFNAEESEDTKIRSSFTEDTSSSASDKWCSQDEQIIHDIARKIADRHCPHCCAPLLYELETLVRKNATKLSQDQSMSGTLICQFCNAAICAGCGCIPEPTSMAEEHDTFKEYMIGWHCSTGRDYVLWALQCMTDLDQNRTPKSVTKNVSKKRYRKSGSDSIYTGGIGYARESARSIRDAQVVFKTSKDEDGELLPVLAALLKLLPTYANSPSLTQIHLENFLLALFRRSSLFEKLAELLRNGSIDDIANRSSIYHAVISLVELISSNPLISSLVFGNRVVHQSERDLMTLSRRRAIRPNPLESTTTTSIAKLLATLAPQASRFLSRAHKDTSMFDDDEELQEAIQICDRIVNLYEFIAANDVSESRSDAVKGKGKATSSQFMEDFERWFRDVCVTELSDSMMMKHHHFAKAATAVKNPPRGRMRKLLMELTSLRSSLPLGIYVKHGDSRLDMLKVIIIGPLGTPYENGMFEFDVFCPENYPQVPPQVQFKTTGGGYAHFNPNLYPCGKVCLSLLGTWPGETWRPNQSTLLQVFISIQSMILCDEPWVNEPGRELTRGSLDSLRYQHKIRVLTVQYALTPWSEILAKTTDEAMVWRDVAMKHFEVNVDRILYTSWRWLEDCRAHQIPPKDRRLSKFVPMPIATPALVPPPGSAMTSVGKHIAHPFSATWAPMPSPISYNTPPIFTTMQPIAMMTNPSFMGPLSIPYANAGSLSKSIIVPSTIPASYPPASYSYPSPMHQQMHWHGQYAVPSPGHLAAYTPPPLHSAWTPKPCSNIVIQSQPWVSAPGSPLLASSVPPGSTIFYSNQVWTVANDGRTLKKPISGIHKQPTAMTQKKAWSAGSGTKSNATPATMNVPQIAHSVHPSTSKQEPASATKISAHAAPGYDGTLFMYSDLLITDLSFDPATLTPEDQDRLLHLKGQKWQANTTKPRLAELAVMHLIVHAGQGSAPAASSHSAVSNQPWEPQSFSNKGVGSDALSSDDGTDNDDENDGWGPSWGASFTSNFPGLKRIEGTAEQCLEESVQIIRKQLAKMPQGRVSQLDLMIGYKAHEFPDIDAMMAREKAKYPCTAKPCPSTLETPLSDWKASKTPASKVSHSKSGIPPMSK